MPEFPVAVTLSGEGVRLRRLVQSDVRDFHRISQDDEVITWIDPSEFTPEKAQETLDRADELWLAGTAALFAITVAADDTLLGTINLHFYDPTRASLGYGVAPDARGQGLATRALTLVSRWAFEVAPELVRQELWIMPGNEASIIVAERSGFQREGVFRSRFAYGDEFRDVIVYSLLRSDPR